MDPTAAATTTTNDKNVQSTSKEDPTGLARPAGPATQSPGKSTPKTKRPSSTSKGKTKAKQEILPTQSLSPKTKAKTKAAASATAKERSKPISSTSTPKRKSAAAGASGSAGKKKSSTYKSPLRRTESNAKNEQDWWDRPSEQQKTPQNNTRATRTRVAGGSHKAGAGPSTGVVRRLAAVHEDATPMSGLTDEDVDMADATLGERLRRSPRNKTRAPAAPPTTRAAGKRGDEVGDRRRQVSRDRKSGAPYDKTKSPKRLTKRRSSQQLV
jgi:hypothetical protein